jgi:WD40 repeat protein
MLSHEFSGHKRGVRDIVWSADGKNIASASEDHTI